MNPFRNFLAGLSRVVGSAKAQAAVSATVAGFVAVRSVSPGMSPAERASLWQTFVVSAMGLVAVVIAAWAHEDASAAAPPAVPTVNVATGDHAVGNQQQPATNTAAHAPPSTLPDAIAGVAAVLSHLQAQAGVGRGQLQPSGAGPLDPRAGPPDGTASGLYPPNEVRSGYVRLEPLPLSPRTDPSPRPTGQKPPTPSKP